MLEKIKAFAAKIKEAMDIVQDLATIRGGLYVDAFGLVMIVRLLAPLKGYAPMTPAEAGMWAATIAAYGYSNTPKS